MSERARHIARQWASEIDDDLRRAAERARAPQPWRTVSWIALWLLWLLLLVLLIGRTTRLG